MAIPNRPDPPPRPFRTDAPRRRWPRLLVWCALLALAGMGLWPLLHRLFP